MPAHWAVAYSQKDLSRSPAWDETQKSLSNRDRKTEKSSTNKRSKDRSELWEGKRRLTMKAFLRTVRRLSHSNVNIQPQQPSRRVGILAPQSVVQIEVSTQSTARRVWDRAETDKKRVRLCVGKSVSSCPWREDGEKQLGSSSQLRQENSCWREEGREGDGRRGKGRA